VGDTRVCAAAGGVVHGTPEVIAPAGSATDCAAAGGVTTRPEGDAAAAAAGGVRCSGGWPSTPRSSSSPASSPSPASGCAKAAPAASSYSSALLGSLTDGPCKCHKHLSAAGQPNRGPLLVSQAPQRCWAAKQRAPASVTSTSALLGSPTEGPCKCHSGCEARRACSNNWREFQTRKGLDNSAWAATRHSPQPQRVPPRHTSWGTGLTKHHPTATHPRASPSSSPTAARRR
jgi:hypothetical protein